MSDHPPHPAAATASAGSEPPIAVVRELRRTRQRRRLGDVEWFDVAYRVYLFALVGLAVVVWASDAVEGLFDDEVATPDLLARGPAVLGCVVAVAVAVGLRNGAEGGPIAVEEADVRHLLLAPIPRRSVLLRPTAQRLRSAAFVLALLGGIAGQLVATELEGSRAAWAASGVLFGALVAAFHTGAAVVAHVTGIARWSATLVGTVLVGWQAGSAWSTWTGDGPEPLRAGPADLAGSVAMWGVRQRAVDVLALVAGIALVVVALSLCGRLRSERLQHRARLVSQLRFAATVQDLRTVVLLRRQLRAETLRERPWGARRRASARADAPAQAFLTTMVRRGITSLRRLPLPRLARIAALAAGGGVAAALTVRSSVVFAAPLLIALFVLGLEALEPLAQEIDRPSITDSFPRERGRVYAAHLVAPAGLLACAGLVGAAAATIVEPSYAAAAFALAVPVAWTGAVGAVSTTVRDAPPLPQHIGTTLTGRDKFEDSMVVPPEFGGFTTTLVVLIPLALSALATLPVISQRTFTGVGPVIRSVIGLGLVLAATVMWVLRRDRWGSRIRGFFVEGREQYAASGGRFS